jgi:hypothetical protein
MLSFGSGQFNKKLACQFSFSPIWKKKKMYIP